MAIVVSGKNPKGDACVYSLDDNLKSNLDEAKIWVKKKNWDYVSIICGLPGAGKSNFTINNARYCCEWFDEKYIAFSADDFIRITNECPDFSSVQLDESFAPLNARVSNSSAFLRIINHLQLIRQKHLFIFLCLPNFFDLSTTISIYRSSHLFVVYPNKEGDRGEFCAFDREAKRELYIRGKKYINYSAVEPNFVGKFVKQKAIDDDLYNDLKHKHLLEVDNEIRKVSKDSINKKARDKFVIYLNKISKWNKEDIAKVGGLSLQTVYNILNEDENNT